MDINMLVDDTAAKAPPLLRLPLEVLLQISAELNIPDLGSLRLSCTHLEASLLPSFSREFFSKRMFTFTEFSLQALLDISRSRLAPQLEQVLFATQRPALSVDSPFYARFSRDLSMPGASGEEAVQSNRFRQAYAAYLALVNSGQDVEMITEAFKKLPNLRVIGVRDFDSPSRSARQLRGMWTAYGSPSFQTETGVPMEWTRRHQSLHGTVGQQEFLSHIFLALLRATGRSKARPQNLEIILRHTALSDYAFFLPEYVLPTVGPVLSNLTTGFFDLSGGPLATYVIEESGARSRSLIYYFRGFLSKLGKLQHLRINFGNIPHKDATDLLGWLSRDALPSTLDSASSSTLTTFPKPTPAIGLPHLTALDIGSVTVEPMVLIDLINKFGSTLRSISFNKVILLGQGSERDRRNEWQRMFSKLAGSDLQLESVSARMLSQARAVNSWNLGSTFYVTFKDSGEAMSWTGRASYEAIDRIAQSIEVNWPEEMDHSEEDEDDDDEEDSDMDVDEDDDDGPDND